MADTASENIKARLKESYDAIAGTYASRFTKANDPVRLGYLSRLIERLKADGKDAANVLELGCGSGIPATKFMLQNEQPLIRVTGNDISTAQLGLARSNLAGNEDRLNLVEGDMLALSFPEASLDAVTGFYSIIHLPREEQTQMMRKIVGWLKPGGWFLANFSAAELPALETGNWLDHEKGWMFWSGWGEEATVKMMKEVGLEVETKEVLEDVGDATFLWILAKKGK